ncbi:MAG: hypothetical protein RBG13Loki_3590, partial [Promethearchaeota archaeon CR_4]
MEVQFLGQRWTVDELKALKLFRNDFRSVYDIIVPLLEDMRNMDPRLKFDPFVVIEHGLGLGLHGVLQSQAPEGELPTSVEYLKTLFQHNSIFREIEWHLYTIFNIVHRLTGKDAKIPEYDRSLRFYPEWVQHLGNPRWRGSSYHRVARWFQRLNLPSTQDTRDEYSRAVHAAGTTLIQDQQATQRQWAVLSFLLATLPEGETLDYFAALTIVWMRKAIALHIYDGRIGDYANLGLKDFIAHKPELKWWLKNWPEAVWPKWFDSMILETIDHPEGVTWLSWQVTRLRAVHKCALRGISGAQASQALFPKFKNANLENILSTILTDDKFGIHTWTETMMKTDFDYEQVDWTKVPGWHEYGMDFFEYMNSINEYYKRVGYGSDHELDGGYIAPFFPQNYGYLWKFLAQFVGNSVKDSTFYFKTHVYKKVFMGVSTDSLSSTRYRMHYARIEAERATTVAGAMADAIQKNSLLTPCPGLEYDYYVFTKKTQKWTKVEAPETFPVKMGQSIKRYIKGASPRLLQTVVGDGETPIWVLFKQLDVVNEVPVTPVVYKYFVVVGNKWGYIPKEGLTYLEPTAKPAKGQQIARTPILTLAGADAVGDASDAVAAIAIKSEMWGLDAQFRFMALKADALRQVKELKIEKEVLSKRFFNDPSDKNWKLFADANAKLEWYEKYSAWLDSAPDGQGMTARVDLTNEYGSAWFWWGQRHPVAKKLLGELVGDAIGLLMDIAGDWGAISSLANCLEQDHGWAADDALAYAVGQYLPLWMFDLVVVNIAQILLTSSLSGLAAGAVSMGIGFVLNLI